MSSRESDQLSSIRAVRPVVASDSLRHFIRCANKLVEEEFGFDGQDDSEPLVFAANMLHVTLFAKRAKAGQRVNELLSKVENYIQAPKHPSIRPRRNWAGGKVVRTQVWKENPLPQSLQDIEELYVPSKDQLFFRVTSIVDATKEVAAHSGRELALVIDGGPVADMLVGQSELLYERAARTNAAKLLPRQDVTDNPLEIPFMRAPFRSNVERDEFVDLLSHELPAYDIGLKPISYRHDLANGA